MSLLAVYVQILGVGTGTDNNIGLVDGDLVWTSHEGQGIIDTKSLNGFGISCNIAQGGALGAFYDEPSVVAYGTPLMEALKNRTISIVGKRMKVFYRTHGTTIADAVQRFDGLVGSWEIKNYIAVNIKCDSRVMFNNKVIPSITVTKDMTLGDDKSKAIGKSLTTTYGNICDFPLVEVPLENTFYSAMISPEMFLGDNTSASVIMDSDAPMLDGSYQFLTASGKYKGKSLLQVLGKWQASEGDNLWITLGIKGTALFLNSSTVVDEIRNTFVGLSLKGVRGVGSGNSYSVIDVEWASHDTNGQTINGIWFKLSTSDIGAFTDAGGWDEAFAIDDTANHYLNYKSLWNQLSEYDAWPRPVLDDRMKAAYSNNEITNDVSFVSLSAPGNIFWVSSSADLNAICKLIGKGSVSSSETTVPLLGINILSATPLCKLIRLNLPSGVFNENSALSYVGYTQVPSKILEPSSLEVAANNCGISARRVIELIPAVTWWTSPLPNEFADLANLPLSKATTVTDVIPTGFDANGASGVMENAFMIPFNDLFNEMNLSDGDFESFIVPSCLYRLYMDMPTGYDSSKEIIMKLTIDVAIVGEGNLVIGSIRAEDSYRFDGFIPIPGGNRIGGWFKIDPSTNSVLFLGNTSTAYGIQNYRGVYVAEDTFGSFSAYENLKSQLNVSEILKATSLKQIRHAVVRVRVQCLADAFVFNADKATFFQGIYNPYVGISHKVERDKLYLRTLRTNTPQPQPTCPLDLAATIAYENGVSTDSTSFDTTRIAQRTLFDSSATEFDGQYQPDDKTGITDALSEIAKQSMTALYPLRDGKLAALWFADKTDESPTVYTFAGSQIAENSLTIDKKQGGYLYTDFVFNIIKNLYGTPEMMYVNTDSALTDLPASDTVSSLGPIVGPSTDWELHTIAGNSTLREMRIRSTVSTSPALLLFMEGSRWLLTDTNGLRITATLASVAPDPQCPLDATGARVVFQFDASAPAATQELTSIQTYGPIEDWKNYVSGTFVTDYTTARNIWEHAQAARKLLGVERAMPETVTKLVDPVWGSDDRALMQWVLYTVMWATREKSILKFKVEANDATNVLWVLDYVEFAWGPYASTPAKGYIVEIADLTNEGLFEITILTCKPESEMLLTLDERFAQNDMTIDERDADNNYTLNEGSLA